MQTDELERRFGRYRNLSGCNYKVSYCQILENEKKIEMDIYYNVNSSYQILSYQQVKLTLKTKQTTLTNFQILNSLFQYLIQSI